jgi:ABC-type transport system substrate-binding protein
MVTITLICLMLISAFATTGMVTVKASDPIILYLVQDATDSEGFHALGLSIKEELAKIGITVEIDYREEGELDDTLYGNYWNYTWDDAPGYGWDMFIRENWCMPTDLLWFESMLAAVGMPPAGYQRMSWNNTKADALLRNAFEEFDPDKRRQYMLLWQQEYVHDNPSPTLYALTWIQVTDKRFQTPWGGPGDQAEWYDPYMNTWIEDPMPPTVQLKVGYSAGWWEYNPIFMWTMAQDCSQLLTHSMLYVVSREWGSDHGTGFYHKPYLAVGDPVWADDHLTCNISLRDDVYWHNFTDIYTEGGPYVYNNELFTADDVICTFEALMDKATMSWGKSDYDNVLDVSTYSGGVEKISDTQVRFHLKNPIAPELFKQLLANEWGVMIVPEHILGSVPHKDWYGHWTNEACPPPGTGPFRFVEDIPDEYFKLEAVPNYTPGLGGQHTIDEIHGYVITDPAAAWTALMNHEIHYTPGGVWSATPEQIDLARADPALAVFDDPIPATRNLAFNLRNPFLSNRYVRQAIAHAINYPHIVDTIGPTAGLSENCIIQSNPLWPMMEWAYPTPADEALYNIGPYPYDIAVAQQYMDKWKYSLTANANGTLGDPNVALGPVGDNDFSGIVELDDFVVWAENVGTAPEAWPWWPGQDIDPDADNTDFVELADFYDWREKVGSYYPFYGAR